MRRLLPLLQIVAAWIFGVVLVYVLGIGNGWEILVIPLAMAFAIWFTGGLVERRLASGAVFAKVALAALVGGLLMGTGIFRVFGLFLPMGFGIAMYHTLARRT